ncbi:hypothetical protein MJO29_006208 [Puccinia striiformis f. sp. tritici]|nr:hypothetical protein MJO29_006208 [Puccinia striiformis f. sp. tritici]
MPHPIVIAAGMAIIVGAGYMIYTELNRKSDEEEAYHIYCATIRAEKESRYRRLQGLRDAEMVDSKVQQSSSTSKNVHHTSLRQRSTHHSIHEKIDYPLIDLGQQFYPPVPRSQRSSSPTPTTSTTKSELNRAYPILAIPSPDPVIFIAPGQEESVIEADDQSQLAPQEDRYTAQEQEQSMDITENQHPLIDWKPQEESTTLGRLLGLSDSPLLTSASLQALEQSEFFETALPSQAVDHQIIHQDLPIEEPSCPLVNTTTSTIDSDSDHWGADDQIVLPTINSPSIDGNWSDLGSESFEHI